MSRRFPLSKRQRPGEETYENEDTAGRLMTMRRSAKCGSFMIFSSFSSSPFAIDLLFVISQNLSTNQRTWNSPLSIITLYRVFSSEIPWMIECLLLAFRPYTRISFDLQSSWELGMLISSSNYLFHIVPYQLSSYVV